MKRLILLNIILLMTGGVLFAQSAKKYYKVGEEFFAVHKYEDALDQYTKALEMDPQYDKAYVKRATVFEKLGRWEDAAKDYDRAIVFLDKELELKYLSGRAHYRSGNYGASLSKLNTVLDKKSNYVEAYQVRTLVYIALERYDEALGDCKQALKLKENEINYYNLGLVYEKLELFDEAEQAYKNSIQKNNNVIDSQLALTRLAFRMGKYDLAMSAVNQVLRINSKNKEGLIYRSNIYAQQLNLSKAVDDISIALNLYKGDAEMHKLRGDFYQQLSRHSDAIVDYTIAIESSDSVSADVYYKRATSYEFVRDFESAMRDYEQLLAMSKYDGNAQRLYAEAEARMFELNREDDKPIVKLLDPVALNGNTINIPRGIQVIPLSGLIEDRSDIKSLKINDFSIQPTKGDEGYEFLASINLKETDQVTVEVSDVYENTETAVYNVIWTETEKPIVDIIAPYASDNHIIYLDSDDPIIYVEGKVSDESKIKSIYIDDMSASYVPSDIDPIFSARVQVENRSKFSVRAEDIYGNISEVEFTLNRDASNFSDNPMGKTWAVFIDNSNYETFASLEGPTKDITLMQTALANYQVHNLIHKRDMSKQEMERFFAIELRDLLRSNRVNSLLVWYAGHGKYVNETGYWIPVDAKRDDEFTYFNINALKASMQSYPDFVTHTLVITDACESGPSFYQAMRSVNEIRSCDDWEATRFKSSQVLSSAGYELAVDNSQFTRTFANTLSNNPDACIPIESIVQKVTTAVTGNNQQKPQFGKIAGLEDENGTFFFIPKDF